VNHSKRPFLFHDAYTSVDAVLGKAKRKSLAWLLSNVSGEIVVDGDVDDVTFEQIDGKQKVIVNKEPVEVKKPNPTTKEFEDAKKEVREGNNTPEEISSIFNLSSDQYQELVQIALS
jgi:hypothetical protein